MYLYMNNNLISSQFMVIIIVLHYGERTSCTKHNPQCILCELKRLKIYNTMLIDIRHTNTYN